MDKADDISKSDALELISKSSIYGNLGLFIGAGMSKAVLNDEWETIALSWKELIFECAKEFKINLKEDILTDGVSYPEIATEIAKLIAKNDSIDYKLAVKKLKEKISELTSWYPENDIRIEYNNILDEINPNWIITTNYDLIIECLLTGKCQSLGPTDQLISPRGLIPIYHLHGIRTNPDSIIITQEDYISLFRPNQYRQHKLSLSIKESTTLLIGYGLGDVNVLTAVDWTKHVYHQQKINYPHDIVQLLFAQHPKDKPYRDNNNILIIEFDNLQNVLKEIADFIKKKRKFNDERIDNLDILNKIFKALKKEDVKNFIDNEEFRFSIINAISNNNVHLISGFLELFSKCIDETWERAEPKNAFGAYNQNLILLLDLIENIELSNISPALLESIAYNFDRVCFYIGDEKGKSRAAYRTWMNRKDKIPKKTLLELIYIAKTRNYSRFIRFLKKY